MSAQSSAMFAKKIYVPAPTRPKLVERLGEPSAAERLMPAGRVFRAVAWNGALPAEVTLTAATPLDVAVPARLVFARIPWSGEVDRTPTETQSIHSVNRVLGRFNWEA